MTSPSHINILTKHFIKKHTHRFSNLNISPLKPVSSSGNTFSFYWIINSVLVSQPWIREQGSITQRQEVKNRYELYLHSNCSEYNIISIKFELESQGGTRNAYNKLLHWQPLTTHMPTTLFLEKNILSSVWQKKSLHLLLQRISKPPVLYLKVLVLHEGMEDLAGEERTKTPSSLSTCRNRDVQSF